MTSPSDSDASSGHPDLRGWAHKKLFLMPPASPEHARRAFVHRLLAEDFLPSAQHHAAWLVLRGQQMPEASWLLEEAVLDQEASLRHEVEQFAARFFDTAPEKRREDWEQLRHFCQGHPNLLSRIELLEEGLDIYLDEIEGDEGVRDLAGKVGKLFVMPPGEAAVRRRAILAAPLEAYAAAAQTLRAEYPRIAALEPGLLEGLTRRDQPRRNIPSMPQDVGGKRWATAPRPANSGRPQPAPSASGGNYHWIWIIVALALIRLAAGSCRDERRRGEAPPVPLQDIERDVREKDRFAHVPAKKVEAKP